MAEPVVASSVLKQFLDAGCHAHACVAMSATRLRRILAIAG